MTREHSLGRQSVFSFLGSATSAAMGLLLVVVLGRVLGEAGSGIVMQAVGVFMIALGISRCGMDSAAIWLLPRLSLDAKAHVAPTAWFMILTSAAMGIICAGVITATVHLTGNGSEATRAISASAWFLPPTAMLLTGLAATRGLGGVAAYVLVGNVVLPTLRPVAIIVFVAAGAGAVGATIAWATPAVPALALALGVLVFQIRRTAEGQRSTPMEFFRSGTPGRALRYAGPRVVSSTLEQVLAWVGIILVGFLAGPVAAGIYAAATRFATSGLIVDTAIRVTVSPLFSRLHHLGHIPELVHVYRRATSWLVLFSAPVFLILAIFAPVALGLLGTGFTAGSTTLAVMCLGAMVTLMAGNIHSILLMGGHSGLAALNKVVVVSVNIILILVLTPLWGILGAAVAWAVSCLLDASLATLQVHRVMQIRLPLTSGLRPLLGTLAVIGLPALTARALLGATYPALAVALLVGGTGFLLWCRLDRTRLHLNQSLRQTESSFASERTTSDA
ncbi:polysaccharide biosynthesis C-terminal domain-containing protein [Galactobacter sp.]|uniref:oligosaccharide flippase family protein n=1 Tax=Galactobacter sp. TaxID=2676125 RepID=UPI0025BB563F|nr:polysaccharide biosynthesis C-terminal domain-containing protein [Galactobacter sp.]